MASDAAEGARYVDRERATAAGVVLRNTADEASITGVNSATVKCAGVGS